VQRRFKWRRTLGALVAAVAISIGGGAALPAATGNAATLTVASPATAAHSDVSAAAAASTTSPVVEGTVWHNRKRIGGVPIYVFAEPAPNVMKRVKHGHNEPFALIARGRSAKNGNYAITLDKAGLAEARADSFSSEHVVNLEIAAFDASLGAQFWFPRELILGKNDAVDALTNPEIAGDAAKAKAPEVVTLNLRKTSVPSSADKGLVPPSVAKALARWSAQPENSKIPYPPPACLEHVLEPRYGGTYGNIGPIETVVGATYSNMQDVTMDFTYGDGQNSTLGAAISIDPPINFKNWGPLGLDFTAGGTVEVSSDGSVPFTTYSGYQNHEYETNFTYQMIFMPCSGFEVQPTGWVGGSKDVAVGPMPHDSNCLSYNPSSRPIIQDTGTAHTFNAGVDIKFWIEFNLSSATGYDQDAEVQYTLPNGGYLCGTTGYPQSEAPGNLIFAGKYNVCKVHC
jgi:hypothetical protein